jgi:hypothetical protein
MSSYFVAIALIMGIGLIGIGVDRLYRAFAQRNPQLGPFRDSDNGCGCCSAKGSCAEGACDKS